jgi:GT2 family glycosyltransferase
MLYYKKALEIAFYFFKKQSICCKISSNINSLEIIKMQKTEIKYILISCCTCRRPNMLKKSLESVLGLDLPKDIRTEVLVVDNDKEFSAEETINEIQKKSNIKINYFIEEKRGIASARNRLLQEAINLGATHIALFDDDELLDSKWLVLHVDAYNQNDNAAIISGPTYNKFLNKYPKYIEKNNIFKSSTTKKSGQVRSTCAGGNVFFPVAISSESNIWFENAYMFMGGEDGDFFAKASMAGYTIIWNNASVNYEMIGDERANIKWILNRHYYNGYSGYLLKYKNTKNFCKKIIAFAKVAMIALINCLSLPVSILFGPTLALNVLGMTYKTFGKIKALIDNKPLNYYENICGN